VRSVVAAGILLGLLARSTPAAADPQACISASEKAQELRAAGKLTQAREQLAICRRAECPRMLQQDCSSWMGDLERIIPSVVLAARDPGGKDLVDVEVAIDGKVVTRSLDGRSINLDPGPHVLSFRRQGTTREESVVVRQGETNRIVTAVLEPPSRRSVLPVIGVSLGIAGLVTAGIGGYVGLRASSDADDLHEQCAPTCDPADVAAIDTRYTHAAVIGAVGGALLVVGVVLLVVDATSGKTTSSTSARFAPTAPALGLPVLRF